MKTTLILNNDDFHRLEAALEGLCDQARADGVFLVDQNGQILATAGRTDMVDATALGSLAAGTVAATLSMARLLGETGFSSIYHEGEDRHMHMSVLDTETILVVLFDRRSSVGLVRLRLRQCRKSLGELLDHARQHDAGDDESILDDGFFLEINEDEIDRLFGDAGTGGPG